MNVYLEKIALTLVETGLVGGASGALSAEEGSRRKGAWRGALGGTAGGIAGGIVGGIVDHALGGRGSAMRLGGLAGTIGAGILSGRTAKAPKVEGHDSAQDVTGVKK